MNWPGCPGIRPDTKRVIERKMFILSPPAQGGFPGKNQRGLTCDLSPEPEKKIAEPVFVFK